MSKPHSAIYQYLETLSLHDLAGSSTADLIAQVQQELVPQDPTKRAQFEETCIDHLPKTARKSAKNAENKLDFAIKAEVQRAKRAAEHLFDELPHRHYSRLDAADIEQYFYPMLKYQGQSIVLTKKNARAITKLDEEDNVTSRHLVVMNGLSAERIFKMLDFEINPDTKEHKSLHKKLNMMRLDLSPAEHERLFGVTKGDAKAPYRINKTLCAEFFDNRHRHVLTHKQVRRIARQLNSITQQKLFSNTSFRNFDTMIYQPHVSDIDLLRAAQQENLKIKLTKEQRRICASNFSLKQCESLYQISMVKHLPAGSISQSLGYYGPLVVRFIANLRAALMPFAINLSYLVDKLLAAPLLLVIGIFLAGHSHSHNKNKLHRQRREFLRETIANNHAKDQLSNIQQLLEDQPIDHFNQEHTPHTVLLDMVENSGMRVLHNRMQIQAFALARKVDQFVALVKALHLAQADIQQHLQLLMTVPQHVNDQHNNTQAQLQATQQLLLFLRISCGNDATNNRAHVGVFEAEKSRNDARVNRVEQRKPLHKARKGIAKFFSKFDYVVYPTISAVVTAAGIIAFSLLFTLTPIGFGIVCGVAGVMGLFMFGTGVSRKRQERVSKKQPLKAKQEHTLTKQAVTDHEDYIRHCIAMQSVLNPAPQQQTATDNVGTSVENANTTEPAASVDPILAQYQQQRATLMKILIGRRIYHTPACHFKPHIDAQDGPLTAMPTNEPGSSMAG